MPASVAASCARGRAVVVEQLLGEVAGTGELLGANELLVDDVLLRFTLSHDRLRSRVFGLALLHQGMGGLDPDGRALELRFELATLGLHLLGIHAGQNCAGFHEDTFIGHDFPDAPRRAGGDVDLDRLDAPVSGGDAGWQGGAVVISPEIVPAADHRGCHDGQNPVLRRLHDAVTPAIAAATRLHSGLCVRTRTRADQNRMSLI
jgi:hypothetical protein